MSSSDYELNTESHRNFSSFVETPDQKKKEPETSKKKKQKNTKPLFAHRRIPESAERHSRSSSSGPQLSHASTQTSPETSPKSTRQPRSRVKTEQGARRPRREDKQSKERTSAFRLHSHLAQSDSDGDADEREDLIDEYTVNHSYLSPIDSEWTVVDGTRGVCINPGPSNQARKPPKSALHKADPVAGTSKKQSVTFLPEGCKTGKRVQIHLIDEQIPPSPAPNSPNDRIKQTYQIYDDPRLFTKDSDLPQPGSSAIQAHDRSDTGFKNSNDLYPPTKTDSYPLNRDSESFVGNFYDSDKRIGGGSGVTIHPKITMNSLDDHERKIIIEFCHLLEKSKQLFNGLRELPQYGHKQWHSYFGRTFDVYTKLWKFQQQHRTILDTKYGLKRWQIGEIASKIGQLYYHFYLRTSETAYLKEAFAFYYAIRGRCYYTKACKEDKCELMVKKLRYYARFIVVCLLLKKIKLVRELIKELDRQIIEYGNTYDPDDQMEWTVVVDEVKAFIQAEPVVAVFHSDNYPVTLSHRLLAMSTPPVERSSQMSLTLQEVIIVGSSHQVKFSELTMDMFRMLQTLERESSDSPQQLYDDSPRQRFISTPSVPTVKGYNLGNGPRSDNPHKYLLFKPTPMQVLVYLSSGCYDLPPNGALLLYISADGQIVPQSKHPEDAAYEVGGVITTSKNDVHRENSRGQDPKAGPTTSKYKELQCLHPGDLYPYTRRPLFIVIDSDNSYVFQNVPRHFGLPLVVLMSPLELPTSFQDHKQQGSLFTLFLHSPLSAFCYITDKHTVSLSHWDRAMAILDSFLAEASTIVTRSKVDVMFIAFMGDDFLRLLLLRFIFCEVTLRYHRSFHARTHLTRSSPSLPEEIFENKNLIHKVKELAALLQVRSHFGHDPPAAPPVSKE